MVSALGGNEQRNFVLLRVVNLADLAILGLALTSLHIVDSAARTQ